jgi:HlyD family secretion protein
MPASRVDRLLTVAVLAALAAVGAILAFVILGSGVVARSPPGVVQVTEIKIAPEISGRLARFAVARGQAVRRGDVLVELSNPELEAALVPARGRSRSTRSNDRSASRTPLCSTRSSSSSAPRSSPRTASPRART